MSEQGDQTYPKPTPNPATTAANTHLYFPSSGLAAMLPMYLNMVCTATLTAPPWRPRQKPSSSPTAFCAPGQ